MRVRVHPHKNKVNAGEERCVSVTPVGGHAYYKGSVILSDIFFVIHQSGLERARQEQVRNVHAWAVGELVAEHDKQISVPPPVEDRAYKVTYHYNDGRFKTLDGEDVTELRFDFGFFSGRDFWVWDD